MEKNHRIGRPPGIQNRAISLVCRQCHQPFEGYSSKGYYCSSRCKSKALWQRKGAQHANRSCSDCGKSFMTSRPNRQAYCSATCRTRSAKQRYLSKPGNKEKYIAWAKSHPDRIAAYSKRSNLKIRRETLEAYGGYVCVCQHSESICGPHPHEFLAIDHIDGRNGIPRPRHTIGSWLKKRGYPSGYRVLCHNCNSAIGFYGSCPHAR